LFKSVGMDALLCITALFPAMAIFLKGIFEPKAHDQRLTA
jgi:hypothetical protein